MAWFKKKEKQTIEEEVPELPELPGPDEFSLPELPENSSSQNIPKLPLLPELKTENVLHATTVKQENAKPFHEMQRSQFKIVENRPRQAPPNIPEMNIIPSTPINTSVKSVEPVYVRLDKFETSLQAIEEVKKKIIEIENILKKTKEIKQKEEQELELWEREVHIIKSRIDAVDKTIFNKLG